MQIDSQNVEHCFAVADSFDKQRISGSIDLRLISLWGRAEVRFPLNLHGGSLKFLLVVLILVASQAHGELYTWKDSRGIEHYTNRKDDIPVRYRAEAKTLDYDREPKAATGILPGKDTMRSVPPEGGMPRFEDQSGITKVKKRRPSRGDRE
jgi:hypothetical protein